MHIKSILGKTVFFLDYSDSGKGKLIQGIAFAYKLGCTWRVMEDREVWCVPQGNLILGENQKLIRLYYVNNYPTVYITTPVVALCAPPHGAPHSTDLNHKHSGDPSLTCLWPLYPHQRRMNFDKTEQAQLHWNHTWVKLAACHNPTPYIIFPAWKTVTKDKGQNTWTKSIQQPFVLCVCVCEHFMNICQRPSVDWEWCLYLSK